MAKPFTFGGVALDVNAGEAEAVVEAEPLKLEPESDDLFRILILGDFSGRGDGSREPIRVDRDNLDDVMRSLGVEANLVLGSNESLRTRIQFEALEHFEPDSLFERCELFREGDKTKEAAVNAGSTNTATEENWQATIGRLMSGGLLDAIVEQHGKAEERPVNKRTQEPRTEGRERLNILMRAVLHEPHYQALEAAWRSLDFLVRKIDSDSHIQIYIFDISKEKLTAELLHNPEFRSTSTYRAVVESSVRMAGAEPWALIVGNYAFDRNSSADIDLLAQLGLLARAARAPFLAEAVPSLRQDAAAFESWEALRRSSHASWLGLAIPRFLLRLPYGNTTATVESFDFEEMPEAPCHQEYLWGNPAFGCAYLIALSFSRFGWNFRPGMHQKIADLPLHLYKKDGATRAQLCAELLLTESDWNALLEEGLMPLAAAKDADWARLVRFQSIAEPPAALSGRWI